MAGRRDGRLPGAPPTISCQPLPAAAWKEEFWAISLIDFMSWRSQFLSPQTGKCLDLFTIKGVEIRPAENLLRVNKIKISNCLGGGNEPFKLLIKINQSVIRLGSFKLKQSKLLFYRQYLKLNGIWVILETRSHLSQVKRTVQLCCTSLVPLEDVGNSRRPRSVCSWRFGGSHGILPDVAQHAIGGSFISDTMKQSQSFCSGGDRIHHMHFKRAVLLLHNRCMQVQT